MGYCALVARGTERETKTKIKENKMKKMNSKHDYHTFTPHGETGIYVSIHQEDTLRRDFGPFGTMREANRAAYNEWRRQVESGETENTNTYSSLKKLLSQPCKP